MLIRILRIVMAFLVGCFAAALAMVLFVLTPSEILGLPPDVRADRLAKSLELATFVSAQMALFSAPFALVTVAVGEMLQKRSWSYYAAAGLIIAGLGFFAQHASEQIGQPTIVNNYAFTAFAVAGFLGGLLYWLLAGRFAGPRHRPMTAPLEGRNDPAAPGRIATAATDRSLQATDA